MKKIRVLQVTSGFRKGVSGGIPSVLHNYCTAPAFEEEFHFEYLSLGYQTFEPYRGDLEKRGGVLHCLGIHSSGIKRNFDIVIKLYRFLKTHRNEFDIIHINSGALVQVLMCSVSARLATKSAVIVHSHNAVEKPLSRKLIYSLLKPLFYRTADMYFACSNMAAQSMFPQGVLKRKSWKLIYNAIDVKRFGYNAEVRERYRKELGVSNKFVIGHVGRFNEQKNHTFLIRTFKEITERDSETVLLLIGTGELENQIKNMVNDLKIKDKVLFLGQRSDVNNLLQAMDCFAFPSLYEGLGMVLIEAQASGLDIIASDSVPIEETRITDQICYLPLDIKAWAEEILRHKSYERKDNASNVSEAGYDLIHATEKLKRYYFEAIDIKNRK